MGWAIGDEPRQFNLETVSLPRASSLFDSAGVNHAIGDELADAVAEQVGIRVNPKKVPYEIPGS